MKSKFKVGDVVNITDDPNRVYVVNESIFVDDGENTRYMYEVSSVYGDEDDIITCEESSLTFQYHDLIYEEYFTEGNRQPHLPAWRGEYYNPYDIYRDFIDLKDEKVVGSSDEYNDCTLPIYRMAHILRDHSVYSRIQHVLVHSGSTFKQSNIDMMLSKLNLLDEDELKKLYGGIRNKIAKLNEDPAPTIANLGIKVEFTEIERKFVNLLDEIDPKDHWPVEMSNIMIMDAIREAYENAEKDGNRQYSSSGSKTSDKPAAPNKGKMLYKGTSTRHKLIIQFWYNFDLDIIETAYPISETKSNRHSR